jgi:integrase/recombinase XerC
MPSILEQLKSIKIKRHLEPYRPTRKLEDIETLLKVNEDLQTTRASKDLNAVLLLFAFWTGLRVSEICSLKLENVFLDERKILVLHGKGGKNRWVAIHPELKTELEKYIYEQRPIQE